VSIRTLAITGDAFFLRRYRHLSEALARNIDHVAAIPVLDALPLRFHRIRKSPLAFRICSHRTAAAIRRLRPSPDVILAIFCLSAPRLDDDGPPFAFYLDYTMALARRRWPSWAPYAREQTARHWMALEGAAYRRARHLFAMSTVVAQSLINDYGVDQRRIVVAGGSGILSATPDVERVPRSIVFNGSDWKRKGGDRVLEAFSHVRARHPDATLTILDGKDLPASPGVRSHGHIADREMMASLLARSEIVLAPARCDPFPGFLIEAMHHGAVPVTSTADGAPEIVGDAGYVVRDGTTEHLADAISSVFANGDLRRRLSLAAQHRVAERFTWDRVAKTIVAAISP
jgi:glycogen synthase